MEIETKSGIVSVNKKTHFGKFCIGYLKSNAWSGWYTIQCAWENKKDKKPNGCSWEAWGYICGQYINYEVL